MVKPLTNGRIFRLVDDFVTMLADELSISKKRVFGAIRRCMPRSRRGKPPRWTDGEKRAIKTRIVALRRKRLTTRKIATALHLQAPQVRYLEKFRGKVSPLDLNSGRVATILQMTRERKSSREIGAALGISPVRVRQLIARIETDCGPKAFTSDLVPLKVAAERLREPYSTLLAATRRHIIPCHRVGRFIYLTTEEIAQIPSRMRAKRPCAVCDTKFTPGTIHQKVCGSAACRAELARMRRRRCAESTPTPETTSPKLRELLERLRTHHIPENEQWIAIGTAVARGGVRRIQLKWLKLRRVLITREDPTHFVRGKPVTLYAASELDIVREVYEKYRSPPSPASPDASQGGRG